MTLPTRDERLSFLRVLAWISSSHWDSDTRHHAKALLRTNQQGERGETTPPPAHAAVSSE